MTETTINPDQLGELTEVPADLLALVFSPGGPIKKLPFARLLAKLIATDVVKTTKALLDADLAWAADKVALVCADPTALNNGWYRKTGASGAGAWTQFEILSKGVKEGADAAAALAQAWAEGTLPGGAGTKSAKEWAQSAGVALSLIGEVPSSPDFIPIAIDGNRNVLLWLARGKLGAIGLTDELLASVSTAVQAGIGFGSAPFSADLIPIIVDANRNVLLGIDKGKIVANGLSDSLLAIIKAQMASAFSLRREPASATAPRSTDGRSLTAWRAKVAKIKGGSAALGSIMPTGDSWAELSTIIEALQSRLVAEGFTLAGDGFISINSGMTPRVGNGHQNLGVTLNLSGWTAYDGSNGTAPPAIGCSIDGHTRYATGIAATATLTVNAATEVAIYHAFSGGGSFRYRIDGGGWTVISAGNVTVIGGLASVGHTLEIDLAGNVGTVALMGFRASKPATNGVLVHKAGNAGQTGLGLTQVMTNSLVTAIAADLKPDFVPIFLSTNDYKTAGATPTIATAAIASYIAAVRAGCATAAFALIAPARSNNGAVEIPQSEYRDAFHAFAVANGHEFYNMHDLWADYATENAAGMWSDSAHVNAIGAYRLVASLYSTFLNL